MARLLVTFVAAAALAIGLVARSPGLALSPGPLTRGHEQLADDCLACHAVLRGTPEERCVTCHALERIGERPDAGVPAFHAALAVRDCGQCHFEHTLARRAAVFDHSALAAAQRERCEGCHLAKRPGDEVHAQATGCGACHSTKAWRPAGFDHAATTRACESCHERKRPADQLHRSAEGCALCHGTNAWKPATFEHGKYFVLDRDHAASCATCHPASHRAYTCYGCHEHSSAEVDAKHREEGVTDSVDCVRCHRSADEHEAGRGEGGSGSKGRKDKEHRGKEHRDKDKKEHKGHDDDD